jgi:hypothetical protein
MLDNHTWGLCLAVVAGMMAALASVSAKLAVTADVVHELCLTFAISFKTVKMSVVCDSVSINFQYVCFLCVFIFQ